MISSPGGYSTPAAPVVFFAPIEGGPMASQRLAVSLVFLVLVCAVNTPVSAQTGEATIAWHVTLAPSWFDPSSAPAQITPFGILYAIHDSMVRPLYGGKTGPGLAEAWSESPDGLVYEF